VTTPKKSKTTTKRAASRSVPRSSARKSAAKASNQRKFFTVSEDFKIIDFMRRNPEIKVTAVAKAMGETLGRSSESIRDRIKRYLSKLSKKDLTKIGTAAKVSLSRLTLAQS
jgi:hypothetical protein